VIGVGEGVVSQLMAKVSAFAEGGIGPGKCISHHTKSCGETEAEDGCDSVFCGDFCFERFHVWGEL